MAGGAGCQQPAIETARQIPGHCPRWTPMETQNKCLIPARTPVNRSIFRSCSSPCNLFGRPDLLSRPPRASSRHTCPHVRRPPRRPQKLLPALAHAGRLALANRAGMHTRPFRDAAVVHLRVAEGAPSDLAGTLALARTEASAPLLSAPVPPGGPRLGGPGATRQPVPERCGSERTSSRLATPRQVASA